MRVSLTRYKTSAEGDRVLRVSWWKPHANGVIHQSPASDREAVATPGLDGIALELQESSTNRRASLGCPRDTGFQPVRATGVPPVQFIRAPL
jgi:hypothetical protein